MRLINELHKINKEFEAIEESNSADRFRRFEAGLAEKKIDPVKTLQLISIFATAIIAVLKLFKLVLGDRADKKIDEIVAELQMLSLIK